MRTMPVHELADNDTGSLLFWQLACGLCAQQERGVLCIAEQVCQGLDEAVQTMKVHEVAEIVVQPQYGYQGQEHEGQKAAIPANSTLQYTVELVELHKVRPASNVTALCCETCAGTRQNCGATHVCCVCNMLQCLVHARIG